MPSNSTDWYHTHGSDKKGPNGEEYDHENFSDADENSEDGDIPFSKYYGKNGWLGTPWGKMKKYNVKTGKITTEGKIKVK